MFTIRSFNDIALAEVNHAKATQDLITDFNIGSVTRTLLEAPAIEIDEFYQLTLAGILDAIPVACYQSFSFTPIDATYARGVVTINFSLPIVNAFTIPADTLFNSNSQSYLSESDVDVDVGVSTVDLYVVCTEPGVQGNANAGTITQVQTYVLPNTATITNSVITSGHDRESEEERRNRFNDYIKSLVRGTPFSVLYAARSAVVLSESGQILEYVTRYNIHESPGHVYVYIYGSGGIATAQLIENSQAIVDGYEIDGVLYPGYRPTGMMVEVVGMTGQLVNIELSVELFAGNIGGQVIEDAIETKIELLLARIPSGGILYADEIVTTVLAVSGIKAAYLDSNENVECGSDKVLTLGTLTVIYL